VKRKRNPRVVMREKMLEAKRWLHAMTEAWLVGRMTFETPIGEPGWNATRRPRRPEEYPENDPVELRNLITYMNGVVVRCSEVIRIAEKRIIELENSRE
jgi:heme/copper-type cytochrome/quinol oxidase subunit 1